MLAHAEFVCLPGRQFLGQVDLFELGADAEQLLLLAREADVAHVGSVDAPRPLPVVACLVQELGLELGPQHVHALQRLGLLVLAEVGHDSDMLIGLDVVCEPHGLFMLDVLEGDLVGERVFSHVVGDVPPYSLAELEVRVDRADQLVEVLGVVLGLLRREVRLLDSFVTDD